MGRRKIEIKAIKDDRNRSVTFLKRKGGLFKKAHELSVLCSVDVAVIIFGSNKKLYQYSSTDMHEMVGRWGHHGGPNEHKGPSDFNGGADDEDEDEENGTPPQESNMMPCQYQQAFPHVRHDTPSASPPIPNGLFQQHPGHPAARVHTPQPQMGSRPSSRNDFRRLASGLVPQPVGPPGPAGSQPSHSVNGFAYMHQPGMYGTQNHPHMPPSVPHIVHPQYNGIYAPPQHLQPYADDRRASASSPNFAQLPPPPQHHRQSVSPPQAYPQSLTPHHPQPLQAPQLPLQHVLPHVSPPSQSQAVHASTQSPSQHPHCSSPPMSHEASRPASCLEIQPPIPVESRTEPITVKAEATERPRQPPLLETGVKKHKGSIFTPIDENRSILSQHLAAFNSEPKMDAAVSRSQSFDVDVNTTATKLGPVTSPLPQRAMSHAMPALNGSAPDSLTPPLRSDSLTTPTGISLGRPRLKVQIPDGSSEPSSATVATTSSPHGTSTEPMPQQQRSIVLPPPSPSASAILSAGATGPPNPFARPPPHQASKDNHVETPASALPSRFLDSQFLPSPGSFYPDFYRGVDSNLSPLNFATPVAGTGPSFLRDDPASLKRKSPEMNGRQESLDVGHEPKRLKADL